MSRAAPSSAAMALRESFGDRRPPDITRKITACVACRKRKVKCHMTDSMPPCTRCKSRGLSCTVNKSIQMLLENDLTWKETIEHRINQLEEKLAATSAAKETCDSTNLHETRALSLQGDLIRSENGQPATIRLRDSSMQIQDTNLTLNLFCSLGAFPSSSTENESSTKASRSTVPISDFISSGILDLYKAQAHFEYFREKLNASIYHILDDKVTLADVRLRSPFLCLSICTTAAYCTGSVDYQILLDTFKTQVTSRVFSQDFTFDEVRALCISAFWLSEVSPTANALAVRISSELNLHRCITKMPFRKSECYERTRLYFIVYVCDHHFALSHGRPPMTRDIMSRHDIRIFLQSEYSTAKDSPLIAHVELWFHNSKVFDAYGADIENPSIWKDYTQIEGFGTTYDKWREEWIQIISLRFNGMTYSQTLIDLYFHSAQLCLLSHVFRGSAQRDQRPPINAHGLDSFAQKAVRHASSIIRNIADHPEARSLLVSLPYYLTTTVAFASVFVLRTSAQPIYDVDQEEDLRYLRKLCDLLQGLKNTIHKSNPLLKVANSLLLATGGLFEQETAQTRQDTQIMEPLPDINFDADFFGMNFLENDEHWLLSHSDLDISAMTT